jgi:glyoxylase-like metal-dependent hydrolase (beta-lactamase superfamily II)
LKVIQEGIYQLVSPFPEYRLEDAYKLRVDREAAPGITRGLAYVLPYFISSRGDNLLLDCGWNTEEALRAVSKQLHQIGASVEDLQRLVITHSHPDHCGLAGRLKSESGCEIALHELERDSLHGRCSSEDELRVRFDKWCAHCGVPNAERENLAFEGLPTSLFGTPTQADVYLKGGEILQVGDFALEVIWTPGHTPGHVCLYEHNHGILFTGDHVLPWITPNISVDPYQRPNPLQDFLDSLRKIQRLKVNRMLPAHEWDASEFQQAVTRLLGHHEARLQEVLGVLRSNGAKTTLEVAKGIRWTTGSYATFSPWMQRAALGEALAHLVFLVHQGRAIRQEDDGLVLFLGN